MSGLRVIEGVALSLDAIELEIEGSRYRVESDMVLRREANDHGIVRQAVVVRDKRHFLFEQHADGRVKLMSCDNGAHAKRR